jgi:hypothetical protein
MDRNIRTGLVALCVAVPLALVALIADSTPGTLCGVAAFWLAVAGFASIAWGLLRGGRQHASD